MSCRDTIHLICWYLEGRLSTSVEGEIKRHLKAVPIATWFWTQPSTRWTDISLLSALPGLMRVPAPHDFFRAI